MNATIVGACLDTGHAFLAGDLYDIVHKLSGHLQMIHANDNLGNYDDHNMPGKGKIGWKRLLLESSQVEFHGGFIMELSGNKPPEIVLSENRHARMANEALNRLRTGIIGGAAVLIP